MSDVPAPLPPHLQARVDARAAANAKADRPAPEPIPLCEVCGDPATVLVAIEWADCTTVGPACDVCAADMDEFATTVELIERAPDGWDR